MKRLVLLAVACATAVVLWVAAAGAAQNGSGGPLAKSAAVTTRHIPLSKAGGAMPRGLDLKGVPSKGNYAFLLKLKAEPTGVAYNAFRNVGKSAARTAAVNQLATVQAAQRSVIAALPSGTHVLYETHAALAGVAVYTKVTNVSALQRISGVAKIYPIAPKKPSLSYAVHLVKAPEVWATSDPGSLGENSTVAIIDTGIDYTHADFGGSGDPADYQTAFANDTIAPTPGSFDPTKFVGGNVGHDFAGDAYDADDPNSVPVPDNNPLDCNSHGTHVAGIVAGYGENPDGSTFTGDYTTLGGLSSSAYQALFRIGPGMAPKAKIISYKVFGCEGSTNVVGAALDRAADPNNDGDTSDHVDVVNMSLGSDFGSPQDGDSVLSNADSALGISVVVAAGNGGDLYDIGGSPGNATRAIGVAASVDAYNQIDTLHATVNGTRARLRRAALGRLRLGQPARRRPLGQRLRTGRREQQGRLRSDQPGPHRKGRVPGVDGRRHRPPMRFRRPVAERRGRGGERSHPRRGRGDVLGGHHGQRRHPRRPGGQVRLGPDRGGARREPARERLGYGSRTTSSSSYPADDDKVASFSSRGIRNAGDVKPDVSAVGAERLLGRNGHRQRGPVRQRHLDGHAHGRRALGARPLREQQLEPGAGQGRHHEHGRPGPLHRRQPLRDEVSPRTASAPAASTRRRHSTTRCSPTSRTIRARSARRSGRSRRPAR